MVWCWSSCASCRGSSCVVRRPLSESYAGKCKYLHDSKWHSAHTKYTNKVYGTTFIQAGEEFTTYDEFCRKTLFFSFFEQCAQCALAHCQPRLHWAKAAPWDLGIGHLGSGGQNVFHHESQRCNSRCNVAAVVVGFRGLRWSSTPLARRVQAGVKNNSKTVVSPRESESVSIES